MIYIHVSPKNRIPINGPHQSWNFQFLGFLLGCILVHVQGDLSSQTSLMRAGWKPPFSVLSRKAVRNIHKWFSTNRLPTPQQSVPTNQRARLDVPSQLHFWLFCYDTHNVQHAAQKNQEMPRSLPRMRSIQTPLSPSLFSLEISFYQLAHTISFWTNVSRSVQIDCAPSRFGPWGRRGHSALFCFENVSTVNNSDVPSLILSLLLLYFMS